MSEEQLNELNEFNGLHELKPWTQPPNFSLVWFEHLVPIDYRR